MAVFTDISDQDRETIATAFSLGTLTSVVGIADGDTETTFLFRSTGGRYIVTLFETGAQPVDLERAFRTMETLGHASIPCPRPVRTPNGEATIEVSGKLVAVVSFLEGSPSARPNVIACRDLGRRVGEIHRVLIPARASGSRLPKGPIHGALTPDNVFFLEDAVSGIINFRLRHDHLLVGELASVLAEWTLDGSGQLEARASEAILAGYHQARPLSDAEWKALPALALSASAARAALTTDPASAARQAEATFLSALALTHAFRVDYI